MFSNLLRRVLLTQSTVNFKFQLRDGSLKPVTATKGEHILAVAKRYDLDLEGACQASLACSTCHVILDQELFSRLPEAKDEQQDLLDLAFGLTPTSRLGCQVAVNKELEGRVIKIPKASRNLYVDGIKPSSH